MKKKVTVRELSRISQKWHLNLPLTEEEENLIPTVREWEASDYPVVSHTTLDNNDEFDFEMFYFVLKGVQL